MNKLTPIFIAGALAISGGLALAQSQMNDGNAMPGHNMSGMEMPADASPSTQAYTEAMDGMMKNRGGSVCLNSYRGCAKWISALVMPLPGLASAH